MDRKAQTVQDEAIADDEQDAPRQKKADESERRVAAEKILACVGILDAQREPFPDGPGGSHQARAQPVAPARRARQDDGLKDVRENDGDDQRPGDDRNDAEAVRTFGAQVAGVADWRTMLPAWTPWFCTTITVTGVASGW